MLSVPIATRQKIKMAPLGGARVRVGQFFLLILFYVAHRGVVAQNTTTSSLALTLLPLPSSPSPEASASFTAPSSTFIAMDSPSSTMVPMLVPITPTPSLPTPLPSSSSPPNTTQPEGLTTDQIVGLAVGVSAAVILVSILTLIIIFFSIRSYMHKSSAVTPLKSPKEDSGKGEVIQVTSVKHGEAVAMDSLPKSA